MVQLSKEDVAKGLGGRLVDGKFVSSEYMRGWRDCAKATRDHLKAVTKRAKGGMNMMMVGTIAIIQDEINGVGGKYGEENKGD